MTSDDENSDNRRKHPRYDLSLLVQLRFDDFDDFVAEYASNISVSGMFIRTPERRQVGDQLYLQFYLKGGQKLIEGLVRVVRVIAPGAGVTDAGFAVEFVNFDEASMALIEEICEARRHGRVPGR